MRDPRLQRDFLAAIDENSRARDRRSVFADFCRLAALSLETAIAIGTFDTRRRDENDREYLAILDRYGRDEKERAEATQTFIRALYVVIEALEAERRDFLGHCYEALNATVKHFGQYLTPDSVARLMGRFTMEKPDPAHIPLVLNDPACGAGALLIEAAEVYLDERGGRQGDLRIFAEDLDPVAADIAYIQLYLLGYPARVTRMDTLAQEGDRPRYTAGVFAHGAMDIFKRNNTNNNTATATTETERTSP
jgi:type I restriction-modification system DNA methylase subunit